MWYIFEHTMQVPSPGNNEESGKVKWDPFLLKSQGACFSSWSPVTLQPRVLLSAVNLVHFGGVVPIMGMGLAGEFEGGQYTASLPVNCQNFFCFCSDFSTTLWVKSKPLSSQWGFSRGFKEADLLCEDKLELHFAKLHMTKIHCSFTAALIINMPHFTLFWVTPLRF